MTNNITGKLRRSAVVMTSAPGAIVDMRVDGAPVSGVSAGLEEWDRSAPLFGNLGNQKIVERRLCKKLGKKYFRLPPVLEDDAKHRDGTPDDRALVLRRFPEWLQCPLCEHISRSRNWANEPGRPYRYCAECTAKQPGRRKVFAIPVRFATACTNGHLGEFPWQWWVPHKEGCDKPTKLKLTSIRPGLGGLIISCPSCKQSRSLDGAFGENALSGLKCQGLRPWLRSPSPDCDCSGDNGNYRVVQRGASNLYYPVPDSALDIPPWTTTLEHIISDYWDDLADIEDSVQRAKWIEDTPYLKAATNQLGITAAVLSKRFEELLKDIESADLSDLRIDEYRVFTTGVEEKPSEDFEVHVEAVPPELTGIIEGVVRVARLREVRVVKGFTRIRPPLDPDGANVAQISLTALDWLPAIEVRGEGIFLQLDEAELRKWEVTAVSRVKRASESWLAEWQQRYPETPLPFEASPRLLMIHAFAHALIRQLTLECGYSSASLRERLYIGEGERPMAGLLIYTATADSDGTLGGLQRRAKPELLGPTVVEAIRAMAWCSSDPLCVAGEMAPPESHSIAACHSCMLVPETSCELHNRFLDRALLVGLDEDRSIGFMSALLNSAV